MRALFSAGRTTIVTAVLARFAIATAASLVIFTGVAHAAQDEETRAVGAITILNRKAVEAYQELNFEEAQKLLRQALDVADAHGLSQHPIRARTYINLGIVLVGGYKDREQAIKMFHQGLQISPEIHLSRALANPQIQAVFDEAVRRLGAEPATPTPAPLPPAAAVALPAEKLLAHDPVRTGVRGNALTITVAPDASLGKRTVILGYRPAGAAVFTEVTMERQPNGIHLGLIPEAATAGGQVEYYIEARGANGKRMTSRGSSVDPLVVLLSLPEVTRSVDVARPSKPTAPAEEKRWVLTLMAGTGIGWTSGVGEVRQLEIFPSGFAWASLGHIAPAIGYMVTPNLLVGVQGRLQLITGAAEYRPSGGAASGACGSDGVCSPAKGAFAVLARAEWIFNAPGSAFRPFVSGAVGGGLIRHVAQAGDQTDCGSAQNAKCFDTVPGGPFLFGPGAGFEYSLSSSLSLVVAIDELIGLGKFTAETDVNLGLSLRL